MTQNNISQIPVLDNDQPVGRLEEGEVMADVISNTALLDKPVKELMQESMPVINIHKKIEEAKYLLARRHSAVLIEDNKKITGIITKSDLMEFIA